MSDKEIVTTKIAEYMNIQRIKVAPDRDTEIENRLCELRAQLQALGIIVEDLVIK